MQMTADKIHRVRGRFEELSPGWKLPPQKMQARKDPWLRRMAIIAVVAAVVMILLFAGYKIGLNSGVSEVQAIAAQVRR